MIYIEYDSKYDSGARPVEYIEFISYLNEYVLDLLDNTYLTKNPRFIPDRERKSCDSYFMYHPGSWSPVFELCYLLLKYGKIKPEEINNIITMSYSDDTEVNQLVFEICFNKYKEVIDGR